MSRIDIVLYGPIAAALGGNHIARAQLEIEPGMTLGRLMDRIGVKQEERGYIFINAVLCDVPGLNASQNHRLQDGDHVGIFSLVHMWPYHYRDGVQMSDALRAALRERGAIHHSYTHE